MILCTGELAILVSGPGGQGVLRRGDLLFGMRGERALWVSGLVVDLLRRACVEVRRIGHCWKDGSGEVDEAKWFDETSKGVSIILERNESSLPTSSRSFTTFKDPYDIESLLLGKRVNCDRASWACTDDCYALGGRHSQFDALTGDCKSGRKRPFLRSKIFRLMKHLSGVEQLK